MKKTGEASKQIMRAKGQIQLIIGPMWSGKTTELLRRLKRYILQDYKYVIVKYKSDTRHSEDSEHYVVSHDREKLPALSTIRLFDIENDVAPYDVIAIDEGQFFPDIAEFCDTQANNGKIVIVAALDATFERKPFGSIPQLISLSESVVKFVSVCVACGGKAAFSKRKTDEKEIVVIGGSDKYVAMCRGCYFNNGQEGQ